MSFLKIYNDTNANTLILNTQNGDEISTELKKIGVDFMRWQADKEIAPNESDDKVLEAYDSEIQKLKKMAGYQSVDIIRLDSTYPQKEAMRNKFLNEHTHAEDEVRFFVEGSGIFYLHSDDKVYQVLCEKNDLISVPAGVKHWFDMSADPHLACIRLFTNPEGWVADFTENDIATRFPLYEKEVL